MFGTGAKAAAVTLQQLRRRQQMRAIVEARGVIIIHTDDAEHMRAVHITVCCSIVIARNNRAVVTPRV